MTNTLSLYQTASDNGIGVYSFPLTENGSLCIQDNGGQCCIGIDTDLLKTSAEERVHLCHELGHCMTGSFYNLYSPYDLRAIHENRADKWAIKKLVPADELKQAVNAGYREYWQLAEYFGVTDEFMCKAIAFYKNAETAERQRRANKKARSRAG